MYPTANRIASLAFNAEKQNNDCDSRVGVNKDSYTNELKVTNHVKVCQQSKNVEKIIQYILLATKVRVVKKGDEIVKNSQNCAWKRLKTNMI